MLLVSARASAQETRDVGGATARNLAVFGGALGSAVLTGGLCLGAGRAMERDDTVSSTPASNFGTIDSYDRPARYELDLDWYVWSAVCYAVLAPFTIAAGASLGGYALDGQGKYWAAAGGVGLGLAAGLLATLVASAASDGSKDETHGTAVVSFALLPALGAALFYALSHDGQAVSRTPPRVMPLASVTEQGRGMSVGARLSF
jgi:hypothetical protein